MHYDEANNRGQFLWTHTTASMGLAYQTTADVSAKTHMSRINNVPKVGTCILVESVPFTTKLASAPTPNEGTNGHCKILDSSVTNHSVGESNCSGKLQIQTAKA